MMTESGQQAKGSAIAEKASFVSAADYNIKEKFAASVDHFSRSDTIQG